MTLHVEHAVIPSETLCRLQDEAARRDTYRKYSSRQDKWGRGLTANPIFVGLVGEEAFRLTMLRHGVCLPVVDVSLRRDGDSGKDFPTAAGSVDVKTRKRAGGQNLVRHARQGSEYPLAASFYVFCCYQGGDQVDVLGWVTRETLTACPVARSRVADHTNYVVPENTLNPMLALAEEVKNHDGGLG